jgi:hypothetical protein
MPQGISDRHFFQNALKKKTLLENVPVFVAAWHEFAKIDIDRNRRLC